MKTKLLLFAFLCFNCSFGQTNFSAGNVFSPIPVVTPAAPSEIFRFRPGNVTQLDSGTGFNFTSSRWFSMGSVPAGTQTFYGLRFQMPNRGFVMGYSNLTAVNPVIQWIGTSANLGNLEFRVASAFGAPGAPAPDLLVATMTSFGNTVFGDLANFAVPSSTSAKVGITSNNPISLDVKGGNTAGIQVDSSILGIKITSSNTGADIVAKVKGIKIAVSDGSDTFGAEIETTGNTNSSGIKIFSKAIVSALGVDAIAVNGTTSNIGVLGKTLGTALFEAGIYGQTPVSSNRWAGYFDGNVFTTGNYLPSDSKLKSNIKKEINATERLMMLNPVTYMYNKISEINLPTENQHGFISQEFANIFPELTRDITKPVFDNEGKIISNYTFKGINYNGLISILTAGFKELHEEMEVLKQELADFKASSLIREKLNLSSSSISLGFIMEQNIPNPFQDQTQIKYELPEGANSTSIIIFDLNGRLIKEYSLSNQRKGIVVVNSSEIGKGFFIYSMVFNGSEILTKKMIIK